MFCFKGMFQEIYELFFFILIMWNLFINVCVLRILEGTNHFYFILFGIA